MDIIESYREIQNDLHVLDGGRTSCIFKALEQFNAEDRKEIASRLHEVFKFNFENTSVQDLVRRNLKSMSPDADLSWIPDWRKAYEALLASN
ncbi:hypothetical protein [Pseudomonas bubulae]|uniref:hypothetical protein n=1 Tax=Pseudomonas bubulae TaxID=2316085 RepID=UPI00309C21D6